MNFFNSNNIYKNLVITDKEHFVKEKQNVLYDKFGKYFTIYRIDNQIGLQGARKLSGEIGALKEHIETLIIDTKNFAVISKILEIQNNIINNKKNFEIYFLYRENNKIILI